VERLLPAVRRGEREHRRPIDLRFPGQWFQTEAGLYQNWMRDYDPTTGRYIEADPLGLIDGASVYGYVRQNPGRWVDPRGESVTSLTLPDNPSGLGPEWVPRPEHKGGSAYSYACSSAVLEFHAGNPASRGKSKKNHWHYYPAGGPNKDNRYHDPKDGDHLNPGTSIPVEDCNCRDETSIPFPLLMGVPNIIGGGGGGGSSYMIEDPDPVLE